MRENDGIGDTHGLRFATAGAPPRPHLGYLVQGILHHGSDAIRRRFLPGLISGTDRWCQGFSEPDAGSDLASLRTRAERDGDEFVITGHKVWTSNSDVAEWCFLLARTDPDVARHKGLSVFALPMHQPGVQQRPLKMINGVTREFVEVTLDGARVPADNMIGEPGEGWPLAMTILSHEREPHELGFASRYSKTALQLMALVKQDPERFDTEQLRIWRGRSSRPTCCSGTWPGGCPTGSTASRTAPRARSTSCS